MPTVDGRIVSVVSDRYHKVWFQQRWHGLTGAATRHQPAQFVERLDRVISFVGNAVLDAFLGMERPRRHHCKTQGLE